jgi:prolyl-tRNA synthetase
VTLRDTPSEAEIISHQLLLKGGYIRRVNSGIYAYMPLMLRVIEKISTIIEKNLIIFIVRNYFYPNSTQQNYGKKVKDGKVTLQEKA